MATMYYEPFKDEELPSTDAIESLLPEYKYIFHDPNRKSDDPTSPAKTSDTEQGEDWNKQKQSTAKQSTGRENRENFGNYEQTNLEQGQLSLLDYQMKELDNYRLAVHKMGKDILTLRDQIVQLEDENTILRRQLKQSEISKEMVLQTTSHELENIDRSELIIRYMTLKQRLQTDAQDVIEYRAKIKRLQQDAIERNEKEASYIELKKAHQLQSQVLQNLQTKVVKAKRLEQACRSQEKVIEGMEKVLNSKKSSKENGSNKVLAEENKRLREELEYQRTKVNGETEKMTSLYEQLEKAEARVITLEKTLNENSRSWARERSDLTMRLREADYGFSRTQPIVLHDYPTLTSTYPTSRSLNEPKPYGAIDLFPKPRATAITGPHASGLDRYPSPKLSPIRR